MQFHDSHCPTARLQTAFQQSLVDREAHNLNSAVGSSIVIGFSIGRNWLHEYTSIQLLKQEETYQQLEVQHDSLQEWKYSCKTQKPWSSFVESCSATLEIPHVLWKTMMNNSVQKGPL